MGGMETLRGQRNNDLLCSLENPPVCINQDSFKLGGGWRIREGGRAGGKKVITVKW